MKNLKSLSIMVLILLIFSSCYEITVKTEINEDGSFTRLIVVNGDDTNSVYNAQLPYPVDDSWDKEFVVDSTNKDKPYKLTYTKKFKNDAALQSSLQADTSSYKNLNRSIRIDKRFGFFYSYLFFEEHIGSINPFTALNKEDYLSKTDIKMLKGAIPLKTTEDSLILEVAEKKMEQYILESISYEIISALQSGIEQLNSPTLNPADVVIYKDSIYQYVEEFDGESNTKFIDYYAKWIGNEEVLKLHNISPPLFAKSDKQIADFERILEMDDYTQVVRFPGLLTETNSINPVGNTVSWKVSSLMLMFDDYAMYAESRIVNVWAFVLSGICVLLLIGVLLFKSFKK